MKKYRCVDSFMLPEYDENGFTTENYLTVKKNSFWYLGKSVLNISDVLLEKEDELTWIEINEQRFLNCFEEV